MSKNRIIPVISLIIIILVLIIFFEVIPYFNQKESKNRVFNDLKKDIDIPLRGVVGIIAEIDDNGIKNHNGIGSGVIFDKKDNIYYALTALHVIDVENTKLKIFTKDTEFSGEVIKATDTVNFEIPDEGYYESMLDGKVEYISDKNDLAIISFVYDGDLEVLEFETKKININDRVVVIGHTEGNRYQVSYGFIKSGLEKIKIRSKASSKMTSDKIIKHNAYMNYGNSGGVALSDNMKIIGINTSGSFSLMGFFKFGCMIPYDIVISDINNWRNK